MRFGVSLQSDLPWKSVVFPLSRRYVNPPSLKKAVHRRFFIHHEVFAGFALITIVFILLGPWLKYNHLPPLLALLIPILLILIPFELGLILYLGVLRNARLSLKGIVLNRETLSLKDYFLLAPVLLFWSVFVFMSLRGLDEVILKSLFGWLPDWFQINQFTPANYSQPVLTVTFVLFLVVNGFAGPVAVGGW
jgi:hypothetical protein